MSDHKTCIETVSKLSGEKHKLSAENHDLRARLRLIAREVDGMGADDAVGCGCGLLNIETWADLSIPVEPWAKKMLDAKR